MKQTGSQLNYNMQILQYSVYTGETRTFSLSGISLFFRLVVEQCTALYIF